MPTARLSKPMKRVLVLLASSSNPEFYAEDAALWLWHRNPWKSPVLKALEGRGLLKKVVPGVRELTPAGCALAEKLMEADLTAAQSVPA